MVFVALVALVSAAVWFTMAGPWYFAPVLYFVGGIIWILYEVRRPPLYRSMGYMSIPEKLLILFLWPLRVTTDLLETAKLCRSSERYIVVGDGDIRKFAEWSAAVHAAKEKANVINQRVMVSDTAKFSKQLGRVQHKSWFVDPDGSIELLPRNFL